MDRLATFLNLAGSRCRDRVLDLADWVDFGPDPSAWWLLALPILIAAAFSVVAMPIAIILCVVSTVAAVLMFIAIALVLVVTKVAIGIGDAVISILSEPAPQPPRPMIHAPRGQGGLGV